MWKWFLAKKSLSQSVLNVKLHSFNFFFNISGFLCLFGENDSFHFTYFKSDFPGIKNLSSLNDLNSLNNFSGINDLYSLISSKKLYSKLNMYNFDGLILFITWKRPLKVKMIQNLLRNKLCWIEGVQHQKKIKLMN